MTHLMFPWSVASEPICIGEDAVREFERRQVDVSFLTSVDRPTGQVLVSLDSSGQASYRFLDDKVHGIVFGTAECLHK